MSSSLTIFSLFFRGYIRIPDESTNIILYFIDNNNCKLSSEQLFRGIFTHFLLFFFCPGVSPELLLVRHDAPAGAALRRKKLYGAVKV